MTEPYMVAGPNDVLEEYCHRCGRYYEPPKERLSPLQLDWKHLSTFNVPFRCKERGYVFTVTQETNPKFKNLLILGWHVERDKRRLHSEEPKYKGLPWVEFAIHRWYTERFHDFIALNEEYGGYSLVEW